MFSNRNILCVSNPSWSGDYAKAVVELMRIFILKGNRVLYVENPFTWFDVLRALMRGQLGKCLDMLINGPKGKKIRVEQMQVIVVNPGPVLPINFLSSGKLYNFLQARNARRIRKVINRHLDQLNFREELIHINAFNPLIAKGTMGEFGEKTHLYYCYDEIEAAAYLKKHGPELETWLMKRVDFTVVSSEGLLEKKSLSGQKVELVKNGVDFNLFRQGFRSEAPKNKRIGYIGSIDDRLDLELLKKLFHEFPDYEFEFVGRCNHPEVKQFLSAYPQVILAGAHRYTELHVFLSRYSAGIIPFVRNEFTAGIYPLKINEYLAAGIPVLSTNFSKLNDFDSVASICDTHDIFIQELRNQIDADTIEKRRLRQDFASENSWENRAEKFADYISTYENDKSDELG